jgi:hypothetical protein
LQHNGNFETTLIRGNTVGASAEVLRRATKALRASDRLLSACRKSLTRIRLRSLFNVPYHFVVYIEFIMIGFSGDQVAADSGRSGPNEGSGGEK